MNLYDIIVPVKIIRCIIIAVMIPLILLIKSNLIISILILLTLFLLTDNRPYWIYIIFKTLPRDIKYFLMVTSVSRKISKCIKNNLTIVKSFHKLVEKHADKIFMHTEKKSWSFREVFELSNQISHFFKNNNINRGDVIGVLLENGGSAESPTLWLGLNSIGAIVALIPPQLKANTLIHALKISNIKALIFSEHFIDVIKTIQNEPELKEIKLYQWNIDSDEMPILNNADDFGSQLKIMPKIIIKNEVEKGKITDTSIYIFTSGTTGLPKAVLVKHSRYYLGAMGSQYLQKVNENDVLYLPLPLHHTAGALIGIGLGLIIGTTIVHRSKFSISNFWKDCVKHNCTIAQYIGEICRFLLNAADKAEGKDICGPHKIRTMMGNGLKMLIWERFQKTFHIDKIIEIYGSTEGNIALVNMDGTIGSLGFIPPYLKSISPIQLIKCDNITGEPIRNENGYCTLCRTGEPGLCITKICNTNVFQKFEGYLDNEATNEKIINNVYIKDDSYFNSGDILVSDHFGNFYFVDRTGDTFRWRGENVSTTQVEIILSSLIGLNDVIVYGVQIPNVEGKAGMATIVDPENKVDIKKLKEEMNRNLPSFAHPIFIRITTISDMTITFKLIKKNYQKDAFDITKCKDPIYFLDPITSNYILLTPLLYTDIINGLTKL